MAHVGVLEAAQPRLQLLAMEGVAVEVAVDDNVGYRLWRDGGGRRLMGGMGWRMEDARVSRLVER